jgi:hypothetical protein
MRRSWNSSKSAHIALKNRRIAAPLTLISFKHLCNFASRLGLLFANSRFCGRLAALPRGRNDRIAVGLPRLLQANEAQFSACSSASITATVAGRVGGICGPHRPAAGGSTEFVNAAALVHRDKGKIPESRWIIDER